MTSQPSYQTNEQLRTEVEELRKENKSLSAELSFHRKIFQEMTEALKIASSINTHVDKNDSIRLLLEENEKLKNQLKINRLSNREQEILQLIVSGKTSKDIAEELNISKLTVDTHRKNMQQKLQVSSTAEMVRIAMMCDW